MEFRLLGHVEMWAQGQQVDIGHPKQRCVLAILLLHANRFVPADQIVDQVWGESPPASARKVLISYVSRLRVALGAAGAEGALTRRSHGYLLAVDPDAVDLHRFRALAGQARAAADDDHASALFDKALALWRGLPFGGITSQWAESVRESLRTERLAVVLARNELALRGGRHVELVGPLHDLVDDHPFDEGAISQLMIALYRSGRQVDALDSYTRARARLADELGIDPSPKLRELERQVLAGDPALDPPARIRRVPSLVPQQLPRVMGSFAGRRHQLAELDSLRVAAEAPLAVITGPAGMGKSALALYWAHRMRDQYPDGQLYLDLYGSRRRPPTDLVARSLRALGVPAARVPVDAQEAAATYRSVLAGRRVLVLLDDVATGQQVRPLLPGAAGCLVLVTSRAPLDDLVTVDGARRIPVGALTPDEAELILTGVLGASRVRADVAGAMALARRCCYRPSALRTAAVYLLDHPECRFADCPTRLAAAGLYGRPVSRPRAAGRPVRRIDPSRAVAGRVSRLRRSDRSRRPE